jgi:hypothetical protein
MREKIERGLHSSLSRKKIDMERRIIKSKNTFQKLGKTTSDSHQSIENLSL